MKKQQLIRLALACCFASLVFVMLLPSVFGSTSIRRWLLNQVLAPQGIEAKIEGVRVGWIKPTRVRGVSIGPVGKPSVLIASEISSDRTLLSAMLEGVEIGTLEIVDPEIHIWMDGESSNLAFPPINPKPSTTVPSRDTSGTEPKILQVHVTGAKLFVKTPAMENEANVFSAASLSCCLRQDASGRTLRIEPGRIIDHAKISPELCAGGLKFVLPILSDATWTKGEFSVDLDACLVDLDNPSKSLVSGKLIVHGIEAGIKNELLAAAFQRLSLPRGNEGSDAVVLADNSEIKFQVREGLVWHEGAEFGLPRVSEDLLVRTSGSVSFDETVDLTVDIPMPLHLIANGPIAQSLKDKSLTLRATGPLEKPEVRIADPDFVAKLIGGIGSQLAGEERPVESIFKGIQEVITGDGSGEETETPVLDRFRERMGQRGGRLRRIFGNGND